MYLHTLTVSYTTSSFPIVIGVCHVLDIGNENITKIFRLMRDI